MSNLALFQLSTTLVGHESDVKAVCCSGENSVVSSSRDKTARLWSRTGKNTFIENKIFLGHNNFVNSVKYLPPTSEHSSGLVISGSSDKTINVFDVENAQEPAYSLIGHSDNVCALDVTPSGFIVSGSWDKTAKIWKNWQESYTLEGHSQAVWAVLAIDDERILTGSADKSIIKWQNGKRVQTLSGHTDCVRALALLPNTNFVSCGNDSTLRIWTFSGQCIQELYGHTSFVYSLGVLPTGEIISSGEDRSVKIWKDGKCIQTIIHPATSVWCVAPMPNGDIVSGSSDGIARIFSRDSERVAESQILKDYDEQVSKHAIPSNQVGDLKKDNLPGLEALQRQGNKEGQVIMIRAGDMVEAHQWSQADQSWHKIGEVVDAVDQKRKQLYKGREYDYVFDVDIGEGTPALKLPYNTNDDPYRAAREFISANGLPEVYMEQIVDFILKNAPDANLSSGSSQFADPFTGASRYTPGGVSNSSQTPSVSSNTFAAGLDPWTRPGPSPITEPSSVASGLAKIIPQKTYLKFHQANIQAILKKINQINVDLQQIESTNNTVLTSQEITTLENLAKFLQNPQANSGSNNDRQQEFIVIRKIITQWPFENRFPGIDLLRLQILYTPIPAQYVENDNNIIHLLINSASMNSWSKDQDTPTKDQETNMMLGLRALTNLFNVEEGKIIIKREASTIIDMISHTWKSTNKNLRIALVTVFLNFSVLYKTNANEDVILQLMATLVELLENENESEVVYRALVTLGTFIIQNQAAKEAAEAFDVKNVVKLVSTKTNEARINSIANEFSRLI
ncbi:phospholipase A-2-activating protein [Gigaspora margarita]|uniref:Phospholipase A-2-activating protein n=1 Tax=Gigaspora margarita TaxID=4874 RepID=A0A8H3WWR9_GIGMA|nr:phospholipase A-2-activating protein [Gigaspora margarita]